MFTRVVTCLG